MKVLRIIAILLSVGGIVLAASGAYTYLTNEDEARANRYAAEQQKLLAEASRAQGTPRERELMKEYEEGKGVTELARSNARQTKQTSMMAAGGGIVLLVVSLGILIMTSRRSVSVQT
jgi:hypothetical protein